MLNYAKKDPCIQFELGGFISTSHNNNYYLIDKNRHLHGIVEMVQPLNNSVMNYKLLNH